MQCAFSAIGGLEKLLHLNGLQTAASAARRQRFAAIGAGAAASAVSGLRLANQPQKPAAYFRCFSGRGQSEM